MTLSTVLLPRGLHPGAWWLWALGLAAAASRSTDPLVLLLILAVAGHVVAARRSRAPWSRSFAIFLKLGLVVIAIRVVAQTIFGPDLPGTVLFTLPAVPLPGWAAGVTLGGAVTLEALTAALVDGLRLATVLACIGAANALANPKRLLASLPAALYELGVAVVVALSFAPALVGSVQRIRAARRLRGRPDRGLRSVVAVAIPVLEDALERSLALAAAMDSRGYGRRAAVATGVRRTTATLTLVGLGGVLIGVYALLDATSPAVLGIPLLLLGLAAATTGMILGGRRVRRSRYRPDPWRAPEWVTSAAGLAAVAGSFATSFGGAASTVLAWSTTSLPWPTVLGLLVAVLPAWLTPPPPDAARERRPRQVATPPRGAGQRTAVEGAS